MNVSYEFFSSAEDPDGDSVAIRFDWGDGDTSNWSSYVPSGEAVTMNHSWQNVVTYYVKAQAKDEEGVNSAWSNSHQIIMFLGGPRPLAAQLMTGVIRFSRHRMAGI